MSFINYLNTSVFNIISNEIVLAVIWALASGIVIKERFFVSFINILRRKHRYYDNYGFFSKFIFLIFEIVLALVLGFIIVIIVVALLYVIGILL